ncbi:hypothetical protein QCA50_005128 [Cerrena zonata]|uniref:SAP domain-containing protein n=1 Tax=Cerrena zonata TaxID=2478898 RepID=A0AAW0GNB9_9APHY
MQVLSTDQLLKQRSMEINDNALAELRDAYSRLTYSQLVLFCTVRSLPTSGSQDDLVAELAHHDMKIYPFPMETKCPVLNGVNGSSHTSKQRPRHAKAPDLPVEILAEIMDHIGDWELAKAVGVPTSTPQPLTWTRATQADHAILTGYLPVLRAADPTLHPPTKVGAKVAVRFGYVNVLDYLLNQYPSLFRSLFGDGSLPLTASHHGRTSVLSWWKNALEHYPTVVLPLSSDQVAEAINRASRNGQVVSLDWWAHSGIPFHCTEVALEMASANKRLEVLQWWKEHCLAKHVPLKTGRAMDMASIAGHVEVLEWWARSSKVELTYDRQAMYHASCHGKVDVLQWWLQSNLQLIFEHECLVGATRHNKPDVLEWWDKSQLLIQYRMCDIEEALEDAIGGGEAAREWWKKKGVDFNANDTEWMKYRNLN